MEVFEAMGTRRSFRFYKPWKEVEDWKIQKMLQGGEGTAPARATAIRPRR